MDNHIREEGFIVFEKNVVASMTFYANKEEAEEAAKVVDRKESEALVIKAMQFTIKKISPTHSSATTRIRVLLR